MTPLEMFKHWLRAAEIDFEEKAGTGSMRGTGRTRVVVECGYFYSVIAFDAEGRLVGVEAYE